MPLRRPRIEPPPSRGRRRILSARRISPPAPSNVRRRRHPPCRRLARTTSQRRRCHSARRRAWSAAARLSPSLPSCPSRRIPPRAPHQSSNARRRASSGRRLPRDGQPRLHVMASRRLSRDDEPKAALPTTPPSGNESSHPSSQRVAVVVIMTKGSRLEHSEPTGVTCLAADILQAAGSRATSRQSRRCLCAVVGHKCSACHPEPVAVILSAARRSRLQHAVPVEQCAPPCASPSVRRRPRDDQPNGDATPPVRRRSDPSRTAFADFSDSPTSGAPSGASDHDAQGLDPRRAQPLRWLNRIRFPDGSRNAQSRTP